jgi:hypothetical protein
MSMQHIDTSKGSAEFREVSGELNDIIVFGYAAQLLDRELEAEAEQEASSSEIPQALGYLASNEALTDSNN